MELIARRHVAFAQFRGDGHAPHEIRCEIRAIRAAVGKIGADAGERPADDERHDQEQQQHGKNVCACELRKREASRERTNEEDDREREEWRENEDPAAAQSGNPKREQRQAAERLPPDAAEQPRTNRCAGLCRIERARDEYIREA